MKMFKKIAAMAAMLVGMMGLPAFAADTDTAALDIDIDSIFYVDVGGLAADWTDTVTADDLTNGFMLSGTLFGAMDVAGNEQYEVTAQMSSATWDPEIDLGLMVNSGGFTILNHNTATILGGLNDESAGSQLNLDVEWLLTGLTWTNTSATDDWTNTVTFTCKAFEI